MCNTRLYTPLPDNVDDNKLKNDIIPQLNHIRNELDNGMADDMQKLFPEGYFFSYCLYGLSWINISKQSAHESEYYRRGLWEALFALQQLESGKGRQVFSKSLEPAYGIFYKGWLNWLRGCILSENRLNKDLERDFLLDCTAIARAFENNNSPYLESYPGRAWPCDSVVAMAVLSLHDRIYTPKYGTVMTEWLDKVKKSLDSETGLVAHETSPASGKIIHGARGTSATLILRFLPEIGDMDFAWKQYELFTQKYFSQVAGIPGILEYPVGMVGIAEQGGDVDSGPLLFGISMSATGVMIGSSQVYKDYELRNPLLQTTEGLFYPAKFKKGNIEFKQYAFGVMPIGEVFLAWAKTSVLFVHDMVPKKYSNVISDSWRIPVHCISLLIVVLVLLPILFKSPKKDCAGNP
ncbi:MAG: hypothetical protein EHM28_03330 [Spirochaetaceae bacterium]|nr:MAG: hypothetical protein EHM28_03330 [Spirochaetaceae bacterium]